ncbi:hypothetical protein AM609_06180 [Actinomyces sp. oral taxon 414]|uniref:hypothetical protein n=1 Tax=Actinomyces sp. oral taxon 414 TaxID=712122 RepID=UPI0006B067AC|nr:hypothetical protein [Actinomyces sp. oral taxon 414]ALC99173.1 hypothetical protein AM609_06180 [Actinomyces sp. oral taxon 414]
MKRIDAKVAEITGEKRDGKKEEDQGRRDTEKKSREDVIVVSADEVGAWHEAVIRRAWCKRCAKTKIRIDRERRSRKYIGVLYESDGRVGLVRLGRCNTDNVVKVRPNSLRKLSRTAWARSGFV